MKPISIIKKLNESNFGVEDIKKFPDWIKEELVDGNDVTAWYCDNCKELFKEPNVVRTDMEDYYGVGSQFPDHHYQDLIMCPNCGDGLSEEKITLDSVVDEFLDNNKTYEVIYDKFCERYPEKVNSDMVLEDYYDDVVEIVKELL